MCQAIPEGPPPPPPITASCSVFISKLRETGRYLTVFKQHGVHLFRLMALNSNFGKKMFIGCPLENVLERFPE